MSIGKTSDLHNHLNGSFSLAFLKKTAAKNGCQAVYKELKAVKNEYQQRTAQQPENGFSPELIGLIWKQFGLIHKIIQDLFDISEGVCDVVQNSTAKYLEIRTTPKAIGQESRDNYIDAFESGLLRANHELNPKKSVGLLSLDRTMHTLEDAKHFIERIITSPHNVLAGIDISGNPLAARTLKGKELGEVILLALNNETAIAIHMGESDTDIEKEDTDFILSALELWKSSQPPQSKNPLHGRVRLGHCIFLTDQQKERIRNLGVPIEVCPTCHSKLNWHLEKSPHPVTSIYKDVSEPIAVGTDDETIFGAPIKTEFNNTLRFFSNSKLLTRKQIKEHQEEFRFECSLRN